MTSVLIIPGIGNSGPNHWQTLWQENHPGFRRIEQAHWNQPLCSDWVTRIETAVAQAGAKVILVAHSLGCLALAHWAAQTRLPIKGAMLVALPDPSGKNFPPEARGFSQAPRSAFNFPSVLISSRNDPYGSADYTYNMTKAWGCRHVDIGACGHINADSGLEHWPQGLALLHTLSEFNSPLS